MDADMPPLAKGLFRFMRTECVPIPDMTNSQMLYNWFRQEDI